MPDRGEPSSGNPLTAASSEEEINPFQAPLASSHVEKPGSKKRLIETLVKRLIVLALCLFPWYFPILYGMAGMVTGINSGEIFDFVKVSIEGWLLALWQLLGVLLVFKRKNKTVSAILVVCLAITSLPMAIIIAIGAPGFVASFQFSLALFGFLAAAISCAVLRSMAGIALQSQEDNVELRCNSIVHVILILPMIILILLMIATVCASFVISEFPIEPQWAASTVRYGVKQFIENLWAPLILCSGFAVATLPVTLILLSPTIRWLPLLLTSVLGLVVTGVFVLIALNGDVDTKISGRIALAASMFTWWFIFLLVCRSEYKLRVVATRETRISRLLLGT